MKLCNLESVPTGLPYFYRNTFIIYLLLLLILNGGKLAKTLEINGGKLAKTQDLIGGYLTQNGGN